MADNSKHRNKMAVQRGGRKRGWVAVAGRIPPDQAAQLVSDILRRRITRSEWVAEAVAEKLGRAA